MPHRYVLYARKSSEEKTRQVQSIEDQVAALRPLIEQGNLHVVAVLTESRSAKAPGRPVFGEMLRMIERGEADAVLCWHLNRLTRNEIDSGTLRWMLRQGTIQEIVTPHRTYRPDDNALITAVESAMGEQFLVELKESTRRGVLSKVEKGWFPGKVPQGYRNDVLNHTVVRDPERWDLVRRAWTEVLSGTSSVPRVAERMGREWGYRAPRGASRGMSRTTLYHILANPFYTGVFEWEGRLYPGRHEPMVSREEFERVQRLLGKGDGAGNAPRRRRRRHEFAYSGLIACGHCGGAVCADRKRKVIKGTGEERFHTYYACARGGRCRAGGRLREWEIEEALASYLDSVTMPEEWLRFARDAAARFEAEERDQAEAVRRARERAASDAERQMDELLTLRLRGLIDDEAFGRRRARLTQERNDAVLGAPAPGEAAEARSWRAAVATAEFSVHAGAAFAQGGAAVKGQIARELGASYVLRRGRLVVEWNGFLGLVREHKQKAAASGELLEPLGIGSGSPQTGGPVRVCQWWGDLLDAIRTKAREIPISMP